MYDLILNAHLCHVHHIRKDDTSVPKYKIMMKRLSEMNTASVHELISMTKQWMYAYKEYVHQANIWIKPNTSTHDMTVK